MPAPSRTAMFLARLDRLRALREFLESLCTEAGVAYDHCLRLNLVLEELFTNTVRHGHGGDSNAPVWITLSGDSGGVNLTYEDSAPPFNPYGTPPDAGYHCQNAQDRRPGRASHAQAGGLARVCLPLRQEQDSARTEAALRRWRRRLDSNQRRRRCKP